MNKEKRRRGKGEMHLSWCVCNSGPRTGLSAVSGVPRLHWGSNSRSGPRPAAHEHAKVLYPLFTDLCWQSQGFRTPVSAVGGRDNIVIISTS
jgi:hypothetical protein